MPTAQNIIDEAKLDFPDETDTRALSDLQSVDDYICFKYAVIRSRQDITLTADTREYSLPSNTVRVLAARYLTSATSSTKLTARHLDWFDEYDYNWRDQDSGTPMDYYVDIANGNIGFHPAPDTTTSGSYPKVTVDVSQRRGTLITSTDFGSSLPSYQAWVEGLRHRMALRTSDERVTYYESLFRHELSQLDLMLRGSAEFQPTTRMDTVFRQQRRKV